jgi:hypothetical protein
VISDRAAFSFGAVAKKSRKVVRFSSSLSSDFWLCPVSQRMISSTSALLRPFLSAFCTYIGYTAATAMP